MFNTLFLYLKYPSTALIIGTVWLGSGIMVLYFRSLPVLTMVTINLAVSILLASIGFRVEKQR